MNTVFRLQSGDQWLQHRLLSPLHLTHVHSEKTEPAQFCKLNALETGHSVAGNEITWIQVAARVPDDFHVIVIGAGVSGVCIGKKLAERGLKFTILEKSPQMGGTWWENTYPGCACDVPSHLYRLVTPLKKNIIFHSKKCIAQSISVYC